MSCEPGRKAPYSSDLRHRIGHRIVWQRIGMNLQYRTIARNLGIAVGTAYNICKAFKSTGEVTPIKPCRVSTRILSDFEELTVIGLLLDNPCLYLAEVCQMIEDLTGISVTASTACRILQRHGLTRKTVQQVALQRSSEYRGDFMAEMDFFDIQSNCVAR